VTAILVFLLCLLLLLILMLKEFGVSCLVLYILLNQMVAFIWGQYNKE